MGVKWSELSLHQRSLIEGLEAEPPQPCAQILGRRPRLERDEQRIFANWCLLHALPFCWHTTHKRTNATVGVFDFWVGKEGRSAWIEFKRDSGAFLRPEQEQFRDKLASAGLEWHIVYSAAEAISILKGWRR